MLSKGVIEPSKSDYAAPVVMIRKKDGTYRLCIDYRKLNAITKDDMFPIPRIDDILDNLGKARVFSNIDLKSGYWQVLMAEEDKPKTAFRTKSDAPERNLGCTGIRSLTFTQPQRTGVNVYLTYCI